MASRNPWLVAAGMGDGHARPRALSALSARDAHRHVRRQRRRQDTSGHTRSSLVAVLHSRTRPVEHLRRAAAVLQQNHGGGGGKNTRDSGAQANARKAQRRGRDMAALRSRAVHYYANEAVERARFLAAAPRLPLWEHQTSGVDFIRARERPGVTPIAGGLFSDPMRAGKSLTFIQRILADVQERVSAGGARFGRPTLIVVPKVNVATWQHEFATHLGAGADAPLLVAVATRDIGDVNEADVVSVCDVVLTTYSTVMAAWRRGNRGAFGALMRVHFRRVVADEAHVMANAPPVLFAAMKALRADAKWYVSGTPLQNSAESLRHVLAFLGVPSGALPATMDAGACRALLHSMMLRRAAVTPNAVRATGADAPPASYTLENGVVLLDFASAAEATAYAHVHAQALQVATTKRKRGDAADADEPPPAKKARRTLFDYITRLRQLCVSPALVPPESVGPLLGTAHVALLRGERAGSLDALLALIDAATGGLDASERNEARAGAYAWMAQLSYLVSDAALAERVRERVLAEPDAEAIFRALERVAPALLPPLSTKERWVLDYLCETVEPAGEKLVVFSGWAAAVDHLAWALAQRPAVRDGTVRVLKAHGEVADRNAVLREFTSDPRATCLVVTHGTCGTGVDLACANHVVVLDPWWNPSVEDQAFARVGGVNQRHARVRTMRLVVRDKIDAYVVDTAEKKRDTLDTLLADDKALRPPTSLLLDWLRGGDGH